jgi:hypothetical protein
MEAKDFLTITIGTIGPINAHVAWADSVSVGVEFDDPLHPSVLSHIITKLDERTKPEA